MTSFAKHLGLAVLILGACALMGATPKTEPAKAAKAPPAKVAAAKSTRTAAVTTSRTAKPAATKSAVATKTGAQPVPAGMRIERNDDSEPVGVTNGGIIPYVEPQIEQVGTPIETRHADGSVELFLNGTGQEYLIMTMGSNGKPQINCVQGPKAAKATRVALVPQREER